MELAAGRWIRARQNLLIIGPSSIGKKRLACALGHMALLNNFSVAYYRMSRLFDALTLARTDGRYDKMLRAIARLDLLYPPDDWEPERLDVEQRRDLLEIIPGTATNRDRDRSSPADCRSIAGMEPSAIPPSQSPSWIVSPTTPTASNSRAIVSESNSDRLPSTRRSTLPAKRSPPSKKIAEHPAKADEPVLLFKA